MKRLYIILAIIFLIGGCDLTSGKRMKPQYFITGNLVVGHSISIENPIFIGKTVSTNGGNISELFDPEHIEAKINKLDSGNIIEEFPLEFYLNLNPPGTNFVFNNLAYIDPENHIIEENTEYEIVVTINEKILTAKTTTPFSAEVLEGENFSYDLDNIKKIKFDDVATEAPIQIIVNTNETIPLYFEFYCLVNELDSLEFTYWDFDEPTEWDQYESDLDGSPRKQKFFSNYTPQLNEYNQYEIQEKSYRNAFVFYGKYEITVYAIDDNYYKYLYKPEGYNFGGVNGGIGYFGSLSGRKIYLEVIK